MVLMLEKLLLLWQLYSITTKKVKNMSKKYIDIMDTTFRDGFQSVFGGRVLMNDFFPAVEAAKDAGITHFEFGGGARFQSLFFYLNENAFDMMDKFRAIVGP